jgi:hypothetical protein
MEEKKKERVKRTREKYSIRLSAAERDIILIIEVLQ